MQAGIRSRHAAHSDESALTPAAPEYTVGDILSGSLSRVLLQGIHDNEVELGKLNLLPQRFGEEARTWEHIVDRSIRSPSRARSNNADIIPIVPGLSAHGAVIGAPKRRWLPGKLILAAIRAGSAGGDVGILRDLASNLAVGKGDEFAAVFLETELARCDGVERGKTDFLANPPPALWRARISEPRTPGERLAADLQALMATKQVLPRYQWYVLIQAMLRLGVSSYQLWLCMLHELIWEAAYRAVDDSVPPPTADVIEECWCAAHASNEPLLELGENATAAIQAQISRYAVARVGINMALHTLDDCGGEAVWTLPLATANSEFSPCENIAAWLAHLYRHRTAIAEKLSANGLSGGLRRAAVALADKDPEFVSGGKGTATNNLWEFLRHTLGKATRKAGDFEAFDQGFFTRGKNNSASADHIVHPGSSTLVALSVCTALPGYDLPASMQDLSLHLSEYGIYAPLGTLNGGQIGRELEELGLTIETPDAGGGRLLVNPFGRAVGASPK